MNKLVVASVLGLIISFTAFKNIKSENKKMEELVFIDIANPHPTTYSEVKSLYESLNLTNILKYSAFEEAVIGFQSIKQGLKNKDILTVIDFTLPSTEKRMYVLDLNKKKLLYHTIVSHGRNSGENYATNFSNRHGSFQSSLGFYLTAETYFGSNGFSMRLDGLEKGINDQARPRAVVIHGADYCSETVIKQTGRLGRSYGCPALPRELNKPIIETIKNGSVLYIYANDKNYIASSSILRTNDTRSRRTLLAEHEEASDKQSTSVNLH